MRSATALLSSGLMSAPGVARLWLAGVAAGVMRWLDMLAFSLYAFALTGSPLMVTLVALARTMPLLLLGAFAATWADRRDRRLLLIACYGGVTLLDVALAVLGLADLLSLPLIMLAALASGLFWVIEVPVRRTMLAELAGMRRVNASMGLEMVSTQLARLLGPLGGGALIAFAGIDGVFIVGALLFGGATLLLLGLDPPARKQVAAGATPPLLGQLRDGLVFVRHDRLIMGILVSTALFNLWYMPYIALAPVVAETRLHLGPSGIGLLMASEGIGAIAGTIWVSTMARLSWHRLAYSLGASSIALAVLLFSLSPDPVVSFVILMLGGFGIAGFATMQSTLVLAATPAAMRVRVMGVVMVAIGTAPIGFLMGGLIAELLEPNTALMLISLFGLVGMILCMLIWPELRWIRPVRAADAEEGG